MTGRFSFGRLARIKESPMTIAVTGANSSVGVNLLSHLSDRGDANILAIVRSERASESLVSSSNLTPKIVPYEDVGQLAGVIERASCLVHLAGVLIENKTSTYKKANVDTAAAIVDAARSSDLKRIVLVSVIGADSDSPNPYFRSKGNAEQLVMGSGIASTIIRTPILLGKNTAGAAGLIRVAKQRKIRLLGGGRYKMRPLDLDDLSRAIVSAINSPPEVSTVYELVGPEVIRYRDLVLRTAHMMGRNPSIGTMPVWMARAGAFIRSNISQGGVTPAVIDVITMDERVQINANIDLDIPLTPLSVTLEKLLDDCDQAL